MVCYQVLHLSIGHTNGTNIQPTGAQLIGKFKFRSIGGVITKSKTLKYK